MRRAGYNPNQNQVLDIINRSLLSTLITSIPLCFLCHFSLRQREYGARIFESTYQLKAVSFCLLWMEYFSLSPSSSFRLDAEKEVDSLDILGDLDFKVKHFLLAFDSIHNCLQQ